MTDMSGAVKSTYEVLLIIIDEHYVVSQIGSLLRSTIETHGELRLDTAHFMFVSSHVIPACEFPNPTSRITSHF